MKGAGSLCSGESGGQDERARAGRVGGDSGQLAQHQDHAAATKGIKKTLVATMSACLAVAVGLMEVVMVVVLDEVAGQLVHVLGQAVREVYKMTNLAAFVLVLVPLAEDRCWHK